MIGLELELDPASRKRLRQLAKAAPDAARKAFFRAASIISRKMRARMNGKGKYVDPWQEVTRRIRALDKREEAKTFGGKLMHPKGRQIAIKPVSKDSVVIGWIDKLEKPATIFQDGGTAETSKHWRQYLYRRGLDKALVPHTAVTPERPIVDPVAKESAGKFPEWFIGAFKSTLERSAARAELRYRQSPATREGARAAALAANAYSALAMITEAGY